MSLRTHRHWHRDPDFSSLLPAHPLPQTTSLRFIRAGLGSNTIGAKEVVTHQPPSTSQAARKARLEAQKVNATQRKGMSFVRGRSGGAMFMPGGLDDDDLLIDAIKGEETEESEGVEREVEEVEEAIKGWGRGMRTKAPGLSRGFKADGDEDEDEEDDGADGAGMDIAKSLVPAPVYQPSLKSSLRVAGSEADDAPQRNGQLDEELDELLPTEKPPAHSSRRTAKVDLEEKTEWAHVLDASKRLANFNDLVPDMAHKFPFTLDPFQQEAVYHLEQGDDVFVAAHTSAGKTVVAEYAVALAQRHMTRCIYTS